jgi:methylmalonyl-CoA mutase N-terminal domain/subunit
VTRHLDALRKAAEDTAGTVNLLYPMHDALRARATVGEVCNVLRDVWGVHHPTDAF